MSLFMRFFLFYCGKMPTAVAIVATMLLLLAKSLMCFRKLNASFKWIFCYKPTAMSENTINLIHVYEQQCVFLLTFMRLLLIYTGQCVLQNHH